MKLNHIITLTIPLSSVLLYLLIDRKDFTGGFNRDVFSVDLNSGGIVSVSTLERPVITAGSISTGLKYNLVHLFSYKLEDMPSHIDGVKYMFDSDYFSDYSKQIKADSNAMLNSDVRVVDFIITDGPFYLGSKLTSTRNWDYFVEGYFTSKGNFSGGATFTSIKLKISLKEARTKNGNPSGVEIYEIKRF